MNDLAKILGIDEAKVNIKSINDHAISFYIQTDIKPYSCPNGNALTSKVHDYRIQKMNIPLQGKSCSKQGQCFISYRLSSAFYN